MQRRRAINLKAKVNEFKRQVNRKNGLKSERGPGRNGSRYLAKGNGGWDFFQAAECELQNDACQPHRLSLAYPNCSRIH
jgi:hypothetical protein